MNKHGKAAAYIIALVVVYFAAFIVTLGATGAIIAFFIWVAAVVLLIFWVMLREFLELFSDD